MSEISDTIIKPVCTPGNCFPGVHLSRFFLSDNFGVAEVNRNGQGGTFYFQIVTFCRLICQNNLNYHIKYNSIKGIILSYQN
jgi:hypothetical protein